MATIFCSYRISFGAELNQGQDDAIVLEQNRAYERHDLSASKQQYMQPSNNTIHIPTLLWQQCFVLTGLVLVPN